MAEQDGHNTGRATSPYHKKCFPPYCDNASLIDKQAISKLDRSDLEDKFIIYADENMLIKKQLRDHERQIQRLQTALARQDNIDKKGGIKLPASMHYDSTRIDFLESENKTLQAKVKVLKQQLLNHSYIHSKESKIAEMRDKQRKRESMSPDYSFREPAPQSAREGKTYSPRRSHREKSAGQTNVTDLKERINVLEQMLAVQKEKFKSRIAELEKSLSLHSKSGKDNVSEHSQRVNENVEMIRLLRLNQEQTAKLSTLEEEHTVACRELAGLQADLKQATDCIDDLQKQLEREREKSRDAQGHLTQSASLSEAIRALEEQIRDLQSERKTLKETNEQLLQLTTGPQSRSDKSLLESKSRQQVSSKTKCGTEASGSCLRCKELQEQLCEALSENQDLRQKLDNISKQPSNVDVRSKSPTNSGMLRRNEDLQAELEKVRKEAQCVADDLEAKVQHYVQERDQLKKELQSKESGNIKEKNYLADKLQEACEELELLRPVASEHKACKQEKLEKKHLEDKLNSALQEVHELKEELESKGKLAEASSKTSSKKSVERANAIDKEYADLEEKLCQALMENQSLRSKLDDLSKGPDLVKEELEKKLIQAEKDLEVLRPIATEHENCWLVIEDKKDIENKLKKALQEIDYLNHELGQRELVPRSPTPVSSKSLEKALHESTKAPVEVSQKSSRTLSKKSPCVSRKQSKITFRSPEHISAKSLEIVSSKPSEMESGDLKDKLCNALMENQMLRKQLDSVKDREVRNDNKDLEKRLQAALAEVAELRSIASQHKLCHKTPVPSSVHSVRSDAYQKTPSPVPSSAHSARSDTGSKKIETPSMKASSHFAEGVALEPPKQPVLVIVSKHEFDTILMNKKKFYSKSEALLPVHDKPLYNCRMDICVYELEVDNHLLDQLSNLERDPYVYVAWSFLGLWQRTVAMPASQAQFCTSVTYSGPITEPMVQHVKEKELVVQLLLERAGGRETLVGEGRVDLMPALEQPARGFIRCVTLRSDLGGHGNVYIAFKMHECCEVEEPLPLEKSLEVGIGHLLVENKDFLATPDATHLYVDYTLLGYCGPELETDSMPRSEVMRFNYTKRLRVNDNNSCKLDPLLSPDGTQSLRFNVISEPCNLDAAEDVKEIGYAEVNLLEEMVYKDEDIISQQLPVYSNTGEVVGKLSVTVIGINTLHSRRQDMKHA